MSLILTNDSHEANSFDTRAISLNCVFTRWLKGDCQWKPYYNLGFDFVQTQLKSKDIISFSLGSAEQISRWSINSGAGTFTTDILNFLRSLWT